MKKSIQLAIIAFFLLIMDPAGLLAQGRIEITPYGGYMFGGKFRFYEGELKINDNPDFGISLDYEIAPEMKITLAWSQMNTSARFKPYYGYDYLRIDPFDVNVGYIQVGTVREVDLDNVTPYGSLTVGAAYFTPQNVRYEQTWKFAATLGGGAKIWLSDRVGLRLQGRLMMPMFWGGVGFSVGSGGAGFTVGASTSMVQGDLTGGLIFVLGD
ncbi:MAG: hypothetical protein KDC05_10200 [Bacteroidales bacterium]|nr:hypothetical protein [Bacteroidales bacterium]